MEYAAYDVLFNKKDWRSKSPCAASETLANERAQSRQLGRVIAATRRNNNDRLAGPLWSAPTDWECSIEIKPPWVWRLPGEDDEEEPEGHSTD